MHKALGLFVVVLCSSWTINPQSVHSVKVGIFQTQNISKVEFSVTAGSYAIITDKEQIATLGINEKINIEISNHQVLIKMSSGGQYWCKNLFLKRLSWASQFTLNPVSPSLNPRIYYDHLKVSPNKSYLQLTNEVYLEYYIAGVVEAESGSKQNSEYYKVQSIITRTYCLSHMIRHENQGFNLCDDVHCQAYKGKSRMNAAIQKAAFDTKGLVLVDAEINLITAAYHSNCGGQTVESQDVWSGSRYYLKSICDTFCSAQPHAYWEKEISKTRWESYFKRNYPSNKLVLEQVSKNYIPETRNPYVLANDSSVHLKQIRKDFGLNSTYFSIEDTQGVIRLKGKGYGHGVGLCQEGAMEMSRIGYSYQEILHYYYKEVHLIDLSALDFFKED